MRSLHCRLSGRAALVAALTLFSLIGSVMCVLAADPGPQSSEPASSRGKELLAERDRLALEAKSLAGQQQWDAAIQSARAVIDLQNKHFDGRSEEVCIVLKWIALWQAKLQDHQAALATWREVKDLCGELYGREHWQTVDAEVQIELSEQLLRLAAEDRQRLDQADQYREQADELHAAGKTAEALQQGEQALAIYTELLGRESALTALSMNNVGVHCTGMAAYQRARELLDQSLKIRERAFGPQHPATLVTLSNLAALHGAEGDLAAAEQRLKKIVDAQIAWHGPDHPDVLRAEVDLATLYLNMEEYDKAEPILIRALEHDSRVYGDMHLTTAKTRERLGILYREHGDYAKAEPLLQQSLAVRIALAGDAHPETAEALAALASVREKLGDYKAAEAMYGQVLLRLMPLGERHPAFLSAVRDLANAHLAAGDYIRAKRFHSGVLQTQLELHGKEHLESAEAMCNVGSVYAAMQDYAQAELLYKQALEIHKKLVGETHIKTANNLTLLAGVCDKLGDAVEAERLFKQSLEITQKFRGPDHIQTATILNNLALVYEGQRNYAEAERLLRRSLSIVENKLSDDHPEAATARCNIARVLLAKGDYQQAKALALRGVEIYEQALHEHDSHLVQALAVTGAAQSALKEYDEAEQNLRRGTEALLSHLELAAAVQSERQQLLISAELRGVLDRYLSLPDDQQSRSEEVYSQVCLWKGAIHARQMRERLNRDAGAGPLALDLQQVSARLTTMVLSVPDPAARQQWVQEMRGLRQRREAIEAELSFQSYDFDQPQNLSRVTPAQLRTLLPLRTALVDVFQYVHTSYVEADGKTTENSQPRLAAFVSRHDQPVVRIDLGPAEPIAEAVRAWRRTRGFRPKNAEQDPAAVLGKLVWQPLEPHVQGCDTLLFSPDGALAGMPLNVLPGSKPGSYLIEDLAIGVIPVPQLVPWILGKTATRNPLRSVKRSLLLVGDVDYDVADDRAEQPGAEPDSDEDNTTGSLNFTPLKSTGPEVLALSQLFKRRFADGSVLLLEKAGATEATFRHEAPQHRWLHLATHGFYEPPGIKSAVAAQVQASDRGGRGGIRSSGFLFGIMGGVALAGANRPPVEGVDDGIMTATELATIDLKHVDLAVLSGCETGLGFVAGGEGPLSLQRSFHVAGARTVVASLWNVPDKKTNLLMQRFYSNLWDKQMPKLEALREAQIWMLRSGGKQPTEGGEPPKRQPPNYWAAFVLSGDWR